MLRPVEKGSADVISLAIRRANVLSSIDNNGGDIDRSTDSFHTTISGAAHADANADLFDVIENIEKRIRRNVAAKLKCLDSNLITTGNATTGCAWSYFQPSHAFSSEANDEAEFETMYNPSQNKKKQTQCSNAVDAAEDQSMQNKELAQAISNVETKIRRRVEERLKMDTNFSLMSTNRDTLSQSMSPSQSLTESNCAFKFSPWPISSITFLENDRPSLKSTEGTNFRVERTHERSRPPSLSPSASSDSSLSNSSNIAPESPPITSFFAYLPVSPESKGAQKSGTTYGSLQSVETFDRLPTPVECTEPAFASCETNPIEVDKIKVLAVTELQPKEEQFVELSTGSMNLSTYSRNNSNFKQNPPYCNDYDKSASVPSYGIFSNDPPTSGFVALDSPYIIQADYISFVDASETECSEHGDFNAEDDIWQPLHSGQLGIEYHCAASQRAENFVVRQHTFVGGSHCDVAVCPCENVQAVDGSTEPWVTWTEESPSLACWDSNGGLGTPPVINTLENVHLSSSTFRGRPVANSTSSALLGVNHSVTALHALKMDDEAQTFCSNINDGVQSCQPIRAIQALEFTLGDWKVLEVKPLIPTEKLHVDKPCEETEAEVFESIDSIDSKAPLNAETLNGMNEVQVEEHVKHGGSSFDPAREHVGSAMSEAEQVTLHIGHSILANFDVPEGQLEPHFHLIAEQAPRTQLETDPCCDSQIGSEFMDNDTQLSRLAVGVQNTVTVVEAVDNLPPCEFTTNLTGIDDGHRRIRGKESRFVSMPANERILDRSFDPSISNCLLSKDNSSNNRYSCNLEANHTCTWASSLQSTGCTPSPESSSDESTHICTLVNSKATYGVDSRRLETSVTWVGREDNDNDYVEMGNHLTPETGKARQEMPVCGLMSLEDWGKDCQPERMNSAPEVSKVCIKDYSGIEGLTAKIWPLLTQKNDALFSDQSESHTTVMSPNVCNGQLTKAADSFPSSLASIGVSETHSNFNVGLINDTIFDPLQGLSEDSDKHRSAYIGREYNQSVTHDLRHTESVAGKSWAKAIEEALTECSMELDSVLDRRKSKPNSISAAETESSWKRALKEALDLVAQSKRAEHPKVGHELESPETWSLDCSSLRASVASTLMSVSSPHPVSGLGDEQAMCTSPIDRETHAEPGTEAMPKGSLVCLENPCCVSRSATIGAMAAMELKFKLACQEALQA